MQLREATDRDALLISRIIAASWRGAYQEIIDPVYLARLPEEYWLPTMRAWLGSGRMYGLVAEADGEPAGCIIYGRGRDEDHAGWGEVVSLYVLPEKMGQGVGAALLTAATDALHADGYDRIYLWCIAGNHRADAFYRRHGFCPSADRVDYRIGNGPVTDIRYIQEENHG